MDIRAVRWSGHKFDVSHTMRADESIKESFETFLTKLNEKLAPNAPEIDKNTIKNIISGLADTLKKALLRRLKLGEHVKWPAIEIPSDHWVITQFGLEHYDSPWLVTFLNSDIERSVDPPGIPDVSGKGEEFEFAWSEARHRTDIGH